MLHRQLRMKIFICVGVITLLTVVVVFVMSFLDWDALQFHFHIDPEFRGYLRAVEDPNLKLDYDREYHLYQNGDIIRVPNGFNGMVDWQTVATYDLGNTVLSEGQNPPTGKVAVRRLTVGTPPGTSQEGVYFLVSSDYQPTYSGDKGGGPEPAFPRPRRFR